MSYPYSSPQDYGDGAYYWDTDQATYPSEQQVAYNTSPASSSSWTMADGSASGGFPASRTHSQESWEYVTSNASMSPIDSSPGVDYSQLSYQQPDISCATSYSPTNTTSAAPNTMEAPDGCPPGLYSLIQDAGEGIYWLLNASYRDSNFPQTIMVESSSNGQDQYVCLWHLDDQPCSSKGKFIRKADLQRHYDTVHRTNRVIFDCPRPNCSRKGVKAFSRNDHMIEHLRMYHLQNVEKRVGGGGKSGRRRRSGE